MTNEPSSEPFSQ